MSRGPKVTSFIDFDVNDDPPSSKPDSASLSHLPRFPTRGGWLPPSSSVAFLDSLSRRARKSIDSEELRFCMAIWSWSSPRPRSLHKLAILCEKQTHVMISNVSSQSDPHHQVYSQDTYTVSHYVVTLVSHHCYHFN